MKKFFILVNFLFLTCVDPGYYTGEDKLNLNLTIIVKANECGGIFPNFPLQPLKKEIDKYAVHACTLAIIQTPCPFLSYPIICLEMFKIDVPNFGPKWMENKLTPKK
jgi:hypothetical protein